MKLARSVSNAIARPLILLCVLVGLVFAAPRAFAQSKTGFTYNGMAYTSYWYNEYLETPQGPDSTAAMEADGVNYATVLATQYVQTYTSNTIAPSSTQTPTDAAVVAAITNLQAQGIKVALKPQVDSQDGIWRGQFEPTDPAAWFASYQTFIVHYATIAQAQGADLFVIGCELKTLSGTAYASNWTTIINAIRAVYSGPITYASNASGSNDEFDSVSFWDQLDLIGVDGYFPLTNHADPTIAQLVSAWTTAAGNVGGFAPETELRNLQLAHPSLPLIFTELGYMSTAGANEQPYNYSLTGAYDPTEQQNCYEAFFEVFSQQSSWVKGVFWWDWTVSPPPTDDTKYSPQNKPAGDITLVEWYGTPTPSFTLAPSPSTLSVAQGGSATDTITVTDVAGFSGSVTLAASGLPSGVGASFATNPTSGSSVLTLNVSILASTGSSMVTITGTSGGLTASTTITLTVTAPFTLSASPASLTVVQGASGTSTITVTDAGGFTGGVGLFATGLPSGVTAAFAASSPNGSSILTLTASGTAATGTTTVTITGNVPSVCGMPCQLPSASTTIALTVNVPPSFTLAPSSPTLSVTQGSSGTSTISVTDAGGFSGAVTLAASGLPSGVTAAFATNPTTGSSVLTLTASSTATTGPATVTINGSAPMQGPVSCGIPCNLTASTTIALTVTAVPTPAFTISPSPSSLSVTQGSSGTSTISVTDAGGFSGAVTLAASSLPSGVTAAFATNPTTSTSVLTLTANGTATTGAATVNITGTSGNLTASTTIALTVNAAPTPGITISASPSSLTVTAGKSDASTITVTPSGGFTGSVTLTAAITSSPNGAVNPPTMSFGSTSPVSITGASSGTAALTLSTTAPGSSTCTAASPMHRGVPWYTEGGAALACILFFGIPARRRSWRNLLGMLGFLAILTGGIVACGSSGGSSNNCPGPATPGTTAGAYTVTVTATAGAVTPATTTVILNVQ
jgi:hypothetical protein